MAQSTKSKNKIVQVVAVEKTLYGLGEDGRLYMFNFSTHEWEPQES